MKLKKVILKNFRGYKDDTIDLKDNMNVLIGKNDVGKSTVLEALDIFFNDIKPDFNDLNKNSIETKISIICLFEVDIDNEPIIIDTSNSTDLKKEFLLNSEGYLEIIKEYDVLENKVSACKTYIIANYPNEFSANPLILQKIDKLKIILETKKSVIDNYDKVNKTKKCRNKRCNI
jgi:putative ATP-dependent endonuclease of the OLD family